MYKKRLLAIIVLAIFLFSTGVMAANQVFGDVAGSHWAAKDIARMKAKGVLGGVSATSYAPNDPVTREMLVVMLVRILGKQDEATGEVPVSFTQREKVSEYARGAMAYGVRERFITDSLLQSDPRGAVSRHEVAEIVVRAMGLTSQALASQNAVLSYTDATAIPASSKGFVAVMKDKGIMGGSADGKFNPQNPLTRAEIASVLNRIDNHMEKLTENSIKRKIAGVTSYSITVENASGARETLTLASDSLVFKGGKISQGTALTLGGMVEVIQDSSGKVLYVEEGQFQFDQITLKGEITDLISGQSMNVITIKSETGNSETYTLSANAVIKIGNKNGNSSDLEKGQEVTAVIAEKNIISIQVSNDQRIINGEIYDVDVSKDTVTIDRNDGLGKITLDVDKSTQIRLEKKEIDLKDLIEGQTVMAIASGAKASRIDVNDLKKSISGTLVRVSYSPDITLTILNEKTKKEESYYVDEDVSIRRDRKRGLSLRDIYAGDEIDIDLRNRVITDIYATSAEDDAEGTVKEIRLGATPAIVITTKDGEEKTYSVASNARIRKDGSNIYLSEIEFGDWVELQIDGTQATRIDVEARYNSKYLVGSVENIHKAAQVIVISESESKENRQVFWDSDTTVIRNDRTRDISYLSERDEVIITGFSEGGLFWARTIVIINN